MFQKLCVIRNCKSHTVRTGVCGMELSRIVNIFKLENVTDEGGGGAVSWVY